MTAGLSIKSKKKRYAIGEPILLDVTIQNLSSKEILLRKFLLLPADDARNTIRFDVTDDKGRYIRRISHTMTGRALGQPWWMIQKLGGKQTYNQTFQLAGMYKRQSNRKTAIEPLWSLGEDPEVIRANEYTVQQPGKYRIVAIYQNREDGSSWPEQFWDRKQAVWTGEVISNPIDIEVSQRVAKR